MSNKDKSKKKVLASRMGKVGGQAVLEGVMMKCGDNIALSVRREDGGISHRKMQFRSIRKRVKLLNLPIIRGFVNYIETIKLSFSTLSDSANMLGLDTELGETKFERWLREKFGRGVLDFAMTLGTVLGVALGVGLFAFLPTYLANVIKKASPSFESGWSVSLFSGLLRIAIFILYIWLVSFMREIRRTFEYHGAEHKSIACYEAGLELTPENAKECTRFHPRCGTSFIFVILIISILIFSVVPSVWPWYVQSAVKILMLPFVMGISFEFLMYAGKHDNFVTKILSAPGLWMQRITTREPDLDQLAVAITSLKLAMPEEFPDFDPLTYDKSEAAASQKAEETDAESKSEDENSTDTTASASTSMSTEEFPN